MKNALQTIEINEIMILSSNDEIMIKGTQQREFLSFETQLYINSTQLNKIINELQKLNAEQEVSEMFKSQPSIDGKTMFCFDATELEISTIEFDVFEQNNKLLQIRA